MGVLAEAPLYIDDTPGMTVTELRTKARRLQVDKGIKFILVDYLQLMHGTTRDNRVQEVSEISQGLKNLARELGVPVLAAAQLSRAMEARGGKPRLSDLRESGSIEQDADVVMFLHREDEEVREIVTCAIEKHRNGPTGQFNLYFNGKQVSFFDVEKKG
jgi:replicative DNA helicase